MKAPLTIDEVLARFTDQEFAKENFRVDPLVYFAVMSLSAGTDPILIIEHLLKERKGLMENYQKLAESKPVNYIVATEETIERMKKDKDDLIVNPEKGRNPIAHYDSSDYSGRRPDLDKGINDAINNR